MTTVLGVVVPGCASRTGIEPAAPATGATLTVSPNVMIGRVIAVDLPRLQAIVDLTLGAGSESPVSFAHTELLSRTDALEPTARLLGTDLRRGRTLGVRILSGRPRVGDEVVWPRR